jgi:hypothetical protein
MPYSPNLKLELIDTGAQSGLWGNTTNNNLGTLLEQAIAGVQSITLTTVNKVLTNLNGLPSEARNAILIVTGNPGGVKKLLVPTGQSKLYVIVNNTTGGFNIELQTWSGAGLTGTGQIAVIPNASSILVYCTGTDCFAVAPYTAYTAVPVTFDGYAAGSTLTVTSAPSAPIAIGQTVYNPGILYNYSGFPSGTTITGFGTGTGGIGTYTLSVSTYPSPPYPASIPIAVGAAAFPQPIVALNTLNQIATIDYVQSKSSSIYLQDAPTADTATAAAYEGQIATTGTYTGVLIISRFYVTGNPVGLGQYLNSDAISDGTYVSGWGTGASDANATFTGFISGTTLTVTAGSVAGTITNAQYIIASGTALASGTKITGGSALSWTVNNSQTLGSALSPVTFTALGPILVGSGADKLGWVNLQIDNGLPMAAVTRTPIISFLSPLQLSNVLFSSNIAALIGTLGTQEDTAVNILGGTLNNVTLSNSTLNSSTIGSTSIATTQAAGNNSTAVATTQYVDSAVTVGMPPGAVMTFAMNTVPTGWLAANGNTISRVTYASLFSAIGTTFGAGDGSTTFKLPDLRGYFARGVDNGRGVDSGRAFGSNQDATGIADQVYQTVTLFNDNIDGPLYGGVTYNSAGGQSGTNRNIQKFKVRPYNVALLYCIKI